MRYGLLLVILLIISSPGFGQISDVLLTQIPDGAVFENRQGVSVNLKNKDVLIAGPVNGKLYRSEDGGSIWEALDLMNNGIGNASMLCDKKGRFYFFYSDSVGDAGSDSKARVMGKFSKDQGLSWSEAAYIYEESDDWQDDPRSFIDMKGTIHLVWRNIRIDDQDCRSDILWSTSGNVSKWTDPLRLNKNSGDCAKDRVSGQEVMVSSDGKIFVSWIQDDIIHIDRSYDSGKRWLKNENTIPYLLKKSSIEIPGISNFEVIPDFEILANEDIIFNNRIFLVWSDQRNAKNDTDVWLANSDNGGDSFSVPIMINDEDTIRHEFLPVIRSDQQRGYVYVAYFKQSDPNSRKTDLVLAYSRDGGKTFINKKLTRNPFELPRNTQSIPSIGLDAVDGRIAVTWAQRSQNLNELRVAVLDHEDLEKL